MGENLNDIGPFTKRNKLTYKVIGFINCLTPKVARGICDLLLNWSRSENQRLRTTATILLVLFLHDLYSALIFR